jgi:hypothetical protein
MNQFRQFVHREAGTFSVETVLVFPLLFWAFGAMFVFWDGFKLNNNAISGTYTVADLVSRQTSPITPTFLTGIDSVFERIVQTRQGTELRVTVVRMAVGPDPVLQPTRLELVWSKGTQGMAGLSNADNLDDILPLMAVGASIIMVETEAGWTPPLTWIVRDRTFKNRVFTSPRFVPQVKFDDGSGLGGGTTLDDGSV